MLMAAPSPIEPLSLSNPKQLYHVNSAKQSTGFFPVPNNVSNENVTDYFQSMEDPKTSTHPDFGLSKRYALYFEVKNDTRLINWVVQVNYFMIDKIDVYVRSDANSKRVSHALAQVNNPASTPYTKNMLGRAIQVKMAEGSVSQIVVILSADNIKRPLYVGMMTESKYHSWSKNMDFVFTVAIGIVLGFIFLSISCFVVARDQTFLWFALSTSSILSLSLLRSPFGFDAIASATGFPYWMWVIVGVMQISILLLVKSFLSIQAGTKSATIFNVTIVLVLLTLSMSYMTSNAVNVRLFTISSLIVILLVLSVGTIKALKNGTIYIIFMIGWLPIAYRIGRAIFVQNSIPEAYEVTLNYYNVTGPYFQVLNFFIQFIALVLRVLEIKKQKVTAETQSEAKTTFLAELSHDLRQPIDAMGLMLEHLEDEIKSDKSQLLMSKTKQLHKSMRDTFSALTVFSQSEAGQLKVSKEPVSLSDILEELRIEHELAFHEKHIPLRVKSGHYQVITDHALLKRILSNFLSNAYKYTNQGGVLLSIRRRNQGLIVQVWDTGLGISADRQQSIFDLYAQVDDSPNIASGNGVGLASAKHLSDLLGLTIELNSNLGRGSVFSLYFPNAMCMIEKDIYPNVTKSATSSPIDSTSV